VAHAAVYLPALQVPVIADRPAEAQYEPEGHEVHELDAIVAWKYPAEQNVQLEHDAAAVYVPARQKEQVVEDELE